MVSIRLSRCVEDAPSAREAYIQYERDVAVPLAGPTSMFADREDAGRRLAAQLKQYHIDSPLVVAIPRGGVVIGLEVARTLRAPLDFVGSTRINSPIQPDVGIGAVASGGVVVTEPVIIRTMGLDDEMVQQMATQAIERMNRRMQRYRHARTAVSMRGRDVVLIDEGIASGLTMRAAVESVRLQQPESVIVAVPVASAHGIAFIEGHVDDVVYLRRPTGFFGIGQWYREFNPVRDAEVEVLLERRRQAELPVRGGGSRLRVPEASHSRY